MKVMINGTATTLASSTLAAALDELGYGEAKLATALNETFVPAASRASTTLSEGDRIEIVTPRQGG